MFLSIMPRVVQVSKAGAKKGGGSAPASPAAKASSDPKRKAKSAPGSPAKQEAVEVGCLPFFGKTPKAGEYPDGERAGGLLQVALLPRSSYG